MHNQRSGWGGSRVGAGRKPKDKRPASPFAVVHGARSLESALNVDGDPSRGALADPPSDLPVELQDFWRSHAPLAIERKTLHKATVPAFKLLCELYAKKVLVNAMVDKGALGGLRVYMQLCKQVEGLMARFRLAPFGKAEESEKPKVAVNPFAQVAAK